MFLFSKAESGNASISSPKSFCCTIRPQKCITSGSRAGLEPRSGGKSVAVQPIVIRLMDTLPFSILDYRQSELAIVLFVCCPDCNLLVRDFVIESHQRLSRTF